MMPDEGSKVPWPIWAIVTLAAALITGVGANLVSKELNLQGKREEIPAARPQPVPGQYGSVTEQHPDYFHRVNVQLPTEDPLEQEKPNLMLAIQSADAADIQAARQLDGRFLQASFTGEALKAKLLALTNFASQGIFSVNRLISQDFLSFHLSSDRTRAEVELRETWDATIHSAANGQCVFRILPNTHTEKDLLVRTNTGWLVYTMLQTSGSVPEPLPCT